MAAAGARHDELRRDAIGLPQVLFQAVTHMAPGAAIAFSILISIQFAGSALPLSVLLALVGCVPRRRHGRRKRRGPRAPRLAAPAIRLHRAADRCRDPAPRSA